MQLIKSPLLAATILSLASQVLACVDFDITYTDFGYGTGRLVDNGGVICTLNSYGDEYGWSKFLSYYFFMESADLLHSYVVC